MLPTEETMNQKVNHTEKHTYLKKYNLTKSKRSIRLGDAVLPKKVFCPLDKSHQTFEIDRKINNVRVCRWLSKLLSSSPLPCLANQCIRPWQLTSNGISMPSMC